MKKIFTLLLMSVMAYTAQAAITMYVKADTAPHFWAWTSAGNVFSEPWPGPVLTNKKTVQGTEFYYYTFDESITTVNYKFNNGNGGESANFTGVTTDRYFTYDGNSTAVDVTEDYGGVIPDAEVTSLALSGNNNTWGTDGCEFTVVEAGKKFSLVVDLTGATIEENFWIFKLRPNKMDWVGYGASVTLQDSGNIIEDDMSAEHNFGIDLDTNGRIFTFTATWGGGKKADENWTLKVEKGNTAGIGLTTMEKKGNGETFNLQGQRVGNSYRGIVVEGGKKFLNK